MTDPTSTRSPARDLWLRIETIHAVTYFGSETQEAAARVGLDRFWVGYFALRAAPLGAVDAGVVTAVFANFAPAFVRRWVPACWTAAEPTTALGARADGASATLRSVVSDGEAAALGAAEVLDRAIVAADPTGRPLFAANRDLTLPDDPVAALWQRCTTLREHRGDGHVAALVAAGLSGLDAHVLIAADHGTDPEDLQRTRGWGADDWAAAAEGLAARGLLDPGDDDRPARLTPTGRALRDEVEATTDRLAAAPLAVWSEAETREVLDRLLPVARAVSAAGILRYPNPIGLPPIP